VSGETLVELVLAVALMGVVGITLLAALGTGIAGTTIGRAAATVEVSLQSYVEELRARPYRACTSGSAVRAAYPPAELEPPALPAGLRAEVLEVTAWDGRSGWADAPGGPVASFTERCPPGGDTGAQRIVVAVEDPGPRGARATDGFVRRRP